MSSESSMETKPKADIDSFFNDATFSDVKIRFSGQEIAAHKIVLSSRSEYFFKAFTGQFPVATSSEIDLGDDDDPKAVRTMIRHIYGLPYGPPTDDRGMEATRESTSSTENMLSGANASDDLMFHIGVFVVADKYDVTALRPTALQSFKLAMNEWWENDEFSNIVNTMCGPTAPCLADKSLQQTIISFCAGKIEALVPRPAFKAVLEKERSLASELLIKGMEELSKDKHRLFRCHKCSGLKLTEDGVVPGSFHDVCKNTTTWSLIGGIRRTQG